MGRSNVLGVAARFPAAAVFARKERREKELATNGQPSVLPALFHEI